VSFINQIVLDLSVYFAPGGVQSIAVIVSVCLSACISRKPRLNFLKFFVHVTCGHVHVAWSCDDKSAVCYILPAFGDDVMFSIIRHRLAVFDAALLNCSCEGKVCYHRLPCYHLC